MEVPDLYEVPPKIYVPHSRQYGCHPRRRNYTNGRKNGRILGLLITLFQLHRRVLTITQFLSD